MSYNKVIVMPLWKRDQYTKSVLEGLRGCDESFEYKILIHLEPGYPKVLDVIQEFDDLDIDITINQRVLGATLNTYNCMEHGFSLSDYVLFF